jgi:hypothetical protein
VTLFSPPQDGGCYDFVHKYFRRKIWRKYWRF